jgi:hypothetical protein
VAAMQKTLSNRTHIFFRTCRVYMADAAVEAEEEKRAVNPIKERGMLHHRMLESIEENVQAPQGFNADFTRKIFGPFILNQLSRCDGDIQAAVNLWCSDSAVAEKKYGHISKRGVSRVTNMIRLFEQKRSFNEDISRWEVSKVTNIMHGMFFNCSIVSSHKCRDSAWENHRTEELEKRQKR